MHALCGVIQFHSKTKSNIIVNEIIPKFEQELKELFSNVTQQEMSNFTGLDIFLHRPDQSTSNVKIIIIFVSLVAKTTQIRCYFETEKFEEIATMFKDTFAFNHCKPTG